MATNKNQQTPTQESISKLEAGVLKYKKVISISVVAVIVVVAGLILLNTLYLKPRQAEASTALAKGQELFAQQQYEAALNGDKTGYIGFLKVYVYTQVRTAKGRMDILMKTDTTIYVMELKLDGTVEEALQQIDDKGYAIPYEADGRRIVKVGIRFSSEERTITAWRIGE